MTQVRLLALALLATFLLLEQGCTRPLAYPASKETSGTGRYQLDRREISSWAEVAADNMAPNIESSETVTIILRHAPWPYDAYPLLIVDFDKPTGQPNADGQAVRATYIPGRTQAPVFYQHLVGTLTETSPGVFAGTFASSRPEGSITAGSFTGARPRRSSDIR